jgi:hypothetical protein
MENGVNLHAKTEEGTTALMVAVVAVLALDPSVLIITGDHSTPCLMKQHSWHPVPVLFYAKLCRPDGIASFGERACRQGGLGVRFPAYELMSLAMANAGRLQKFGAYADYWEYTKSEHIDKGLGGMTGNASENFIFKVPSLRNIAKTGPYFHDGSVKDLSDAIKIMAKLQLNADLSETEVSNLVAFLGALTGEVPLQFQTAPVELKKSIN